MERARACGGGDGARDGAAAWRRVAATSALGNGPDRRRRAPHIHAVNGRTLLVRSSQPSSEPASANAVGPKVAAFYGCLIISLGAAVSATAARGCGEARTTS